MPSEWNTRIFRTELLRKSWRQHVIPLSRGWHVCLQCCLVALEIRVQFVFTCLATLTGAPFWDPRVFGTPAGGETDESNVCLMKYVHSVGYEPNDETQRHVEGVDEESSCRRRGVSCCVLRRCCCAMLGSSVIDNMFSVSSFLLFQFANIFRRNKPCIFVLHIITLSGLSFFIFHKLIKVAFPSLGRSSRFPLSSCRDDKSWVPPIYVERCGDWTGAKKAACTSIDRR